MITLAQFVNKKQLLDDQVKVTEIAMLESQLTKENFRESAERVYEVMFGEKAEPDVFTGHKFFKTKVVKPTFTRADLMKKGLQAFRMVFARHAEKIRLPGNPEFDSKGLVQFENFLPDSQVKQVIEDINTFPLIENIQPSNNINNITKEKTPGIYDLIFNSDLFNICVQAVHRTSDDQSAWDHFTKTTYIQRLENVPGPNDIQKVCHSDVFYPCLKYWYFPEGVTLEQGPFNFALNSVDLTYEVLDYWHEESIKIVTDTWDQRKNKGHAEGSLRALPEDLDRMRFKLTPIEVPPNTLVIGNTSGWHARGDAKVRSVRNAVHGAIRVETPFDVY